MKLEKKCVCVRACVHVYVHACVRVCVHVYVHACMRVCVHVYVHACMRVCVHVYVHACMHVRVRRHAWPHAYVCTYAQYVYLYTFTVSMNVVFLCTSSYV